MKTLLLVLGILLSATALAETPLTTDTLHVSGNCTSCKKKIEAPFKNTKGIESAAWNKHTKLFIVTYDAAQISIQKIKEMIVAQGYDTEGMTASDETYNKLPKCCKYRSGGHED